MKGLVDKAIIPENTFHADLVILHMMNPDMTNEPIRLIMQVWSCKLKQNVDKRCSVFTTALDLAYVNHYEYTGTNEKEKPHQTINSHKFQDLVLKDKLLEAVIRVHVHATTKYSHLTYDDSTRVIPTFTMPEQSLHFISIGDLEKVINEKNSVELIRRVVDEAIEL